MKPIRTGIDKEVQEIVFGKTFHSLSEIEKERSSIQ